MEMLGFLDPVRSQSADSWDTRPVNAARNRNAARADSDFTATLLAMAGHDLRQPLQVITNAHDILAQTLASEEQREELIRAADATRQLAGMLGQLVEALQLREQPNHNLPLPVPLRPILEDLAEEFAEAARLKRITFLVTGTRSV